MALSVFIRITIASSIFMGAGNENAMVLSVNYSKVAKIRGSHPAVQAVPAGLVPRSLDSIQLRGRCAVETVPIPSRLLQNVCVS